MKLLLTLIFVTALAGTGFAATPEPPAKVQFTIVNPTGIRWQVRQSEAEAWLANPPAKQFTALLKAMREYHGFKKRLAEIDSQIDGLSREYDRLNVEFYAVDGSLRLDVSRQQNQVTARVNELRRNKRDIGKSFDAFRAKNNGDALEVPTITVVAKQLDWRIEQKTVWQFVGLVPAEKQE